MSLLRSAAFRSVALATLLPFVLALVGVIWVDVSLRRAQQAEATQRLQAEVQGLAALYDQRRIPALRSAIDFRSRQDDPAGSVFLLLDRNGTILAGNLQDWPVALPQGEAGPLPVRVGGVDYLMQAQVLRGGFPVLAGVSLAPAQETLGRMRAVFAGLGALMLLAGLGAAAIAARVARQRVAEVNRALDRIGREGGLTARLPEAATRDEHAELVGRVNAMLDRIAHLFDAHQRLGNAVAHEMRTPLARIQTQLAALDLDSVARAGLDEEIRTTIRLFDSLLSIARMDAEAGDTTGLVPLDLGEVATGIVELYQPVAEEDGRRIELSADKDATILGDAQLMAQLLSNLVENGLKYTRPGDVIRVVVAREGERVRLRVSDTGPGIEDALKARLFTPFARGDATRSQPGHGLGLSLVRAIALRHGAVPRVLEAEKGFAIEIDCLHFSAGSQN